MVNHKNLGFDNSFLNVRHNSHAFISKQSIAGFFVGIENKKVRTCQFLSIQSIFSKGFS